MDRLWADESLLHKDDAAIMADLDVLARDVSSEMLVTAMLRAYQAASEAAQSRLDDVLPHWLAQNKHAKTLRDMAVEQSLGPDLRPLALLWLAAAGMDTIELEKQPSLFLEAYYYDDEGQWGDKSQAYVAVFWYTDRRKTRAQGFAFLLDYNPPWDGSVKDVLIPPRRAPRRLLKEFLDIWKSGHMEPASISPQRAKTVILTALNCNREAEIRLPRDMINDRSLFEQLVLSLPDEPDTPAFTMEDFDFLAQHGERPEKIVHTEQTLGHRIRLENGKEAVIVDLRDRKNQDWW